jgi:hypothetical protein
VGLAASMGPNGIDEMVKDAKIVMLSTEGFPGFKSVVSNAFVDSSRIDY